jgi:thioredoxin 1
MNEGSEETDEELRKIREKKLTELKYQASHPNAPKQALDTEGQVYLLSVLNFWELVQKYHKVVIECYADWCRPCKAIEPILQKLATAHTNILFA